MAASLQLTNLLKKLEIITEEQTKNVPDSEHILPIRYFGRRHEIDELATIHAVAEQLGIDYIDLVDENVSARLTTDKYIPLLDPELCWGRKFIPLYERDHAVVAAFANPLDFDAMKLLEFALGRPIIVVISEEQKICHLLNHYLPNPGMQFADATSEEEAEQPDETDRGVPLSSMCEDLDLRDPDAAPIIRFTNKIVASAVAEDASDIHFEPTADEFVIRFRIDGIMHHMLSAPKNAQAAIFSRIKLMSHMDISERRRPQDGRMRIKVADEQIDLRVSTVPTAYGEKLVLRLLRPTVGEVNFRSLGMPVEIERRILDVVNGTARMLLVTGPTGSGKTTTLYSALLQVNDGTKNIETVEDPIEYRIPGVNQIQLNKTADITFANALRSILRQDPDIIMVGEIRDGETVDISLQAAQTGHLVLSTLHTNDAPSAISRLLNLGADPFVVSTSLAGILAQRLVRKICPNCVDNLNASACEEIAYLTERHEIERSWLKHGRGCTKCRFTGYVGRVGIFSYFPITPKIADLIVQSAPLSQMVTVAREYGYRDLDEAGFELLKAGITTMDELRPYLVEERVGVEQENKTRRIQSKSTSLSSSVDSPSLHDPNHPVLLYIDDHSVVADALGLLFQAEDMTVVEACEQREALEKIESIDPDLLVLNLDLNSIDAGALIKAAKSPSRNRKVPVLVLRDCATDKDEIELLMAGADDYLCSERNPAIVLLRVRKLLSSLRQSIV